MEKESIRSKLMKELGISNDEVKQLIHMYAVRNKGKINMKKIEEDVKGFSSEIISNIGYLYKDYDAAHEILNCGKDRQENAIVNLLSKESYIAALKYLPNRYYINVNNWVMTLYNAAKESFSKVLEGDIEQYREFVNSLPYRNINRVADFFNMEGAVAKFIVENGTVKDFQDFMTDVRPVRDSEEVDRKSCPGKLTKKIFKSIKESNDKGDKIEFKRINAMKALARINKMDNITDEQREDLETKLLGSFIRLPNDNNFNILLNLDMPEKYERLVEYIEKSETMTTNERNELYLGIMTEVSSIKMSEEYKRLIYELQGTKELDPRSLLKKINESKLASDRNSLIIKRNEENEETKVKISIPLSRDIWFRNEETGVIRVVSEIDVDLCGEELKDIIDRVNRADYIRAQREMYLMAEGGVGEISLAENNYDMRRRIDKSSENIVGYLREDKDSPYVVYNSINNLVVKAPFSRIEDLMYINQEVLEMDDEQRERFNNKNPLSNKNEHSYRIDFNIGDEVCHIKEDDWTNGGKYTVAWMGQENNYPEKAMGISGSRSDWARCMCGIDEMAFARFVAQNPRRFGRFMNEKAGSTNCCGLFPTIHVEDICRSFLEMPTEKEIEAEEYVEELMKKEKELEELNNKKADAEQLLEEYTQLSQKVVVKEEK